MHVLVVMENHNILKCTPAVYREILFSQERLASCEKKNRIATLLKALCRSASPLERARNAAVFVAPLTCRYLQLVRLTRPLPAATFPSHFMRPTLPKLRANVRQSDVSMAAPRSNAVSVLNNSFLAGYYWESLRRASPGGVLGVE